MDPIPGTTTSLNGFGINQERDRRGQDRRNSAHGSAITPDRGLPEHTLAIRDLPKHVLTIHDLPRRDLGRVLALGIRGRRLIILNRPRLSQFRPQQQRLSPRPKHATIILHSRPFSPATLTGRATRLQPFAPRRAILSTLNSTFATARLPAVPRLEERTIIVPAGQVTEPASGTQRTLVNSFTSLVSHMCMSHLVLYAISSAETRHVQRCY